MKLTEEQKTVVREVHSKTEPKVLGLSEMVSMIKDAICDDEINVNDCDSDELREFVSTLEEEREATLNSII